MLLAPPRDNSNTVGRPELATVEARAVDRAVDLVTVEARAAQAAAAAAAAAAVRTVTTMRVR